MSERFAQQLPTGWPLPAVGAGPTIEGWRTEQSGWGVFSAHRDPDRTLTEHEMLAGLTGHLLAETAEELLRLADEQHDIEDRLNGIPLVCPHCGRGQSDAPLIVTADESSVTAERCARSYATSADCPHDDVEWTRPNPLPDGARCRECGTWWRLDLIPAEVEARLKGGTPPPGDNRPAGADRKHP
ncbi:hypothetical protein OG884_12040 [Streptosporangium sp. NBC_01755]|uniref:hypothetical protein n=1 Tax=Streptosporangium sp. NBC_01755 TaxID=2975949 RepID=UPI002DDA1C68|nr:hypothetical protein [Streptosporangium sp. NBC_01755]WSD02593.1 hypothetical protein OG884_12040 [Streptosporangium sp. NBC_01755]